MQTLLFKFILILALSWSVTSSEDGSKYNAAEVIDKSPSELVELRGFKSETHFAITKDGYHIHILRIVNPKNEDETGVFKRPVIFNHGLLESGTIWLINARGVEPMTPPRECGLVQSNHTNADGIDTLHMNGPFMLSNYGYDVWVMSMRGTDWSNEHENLSSKNSKFWDYSLDDFALTDVPTVIDYVRRKTGAPKIGYVGHSQATFSVFGLLSIRPRYSRVLEPIIAVAPVSYFDNITSMGRILFVGAYKVMGAHRHGPFPWNARMMRKMMGKFCQLNMQDLICQLMHLYVSGKGKDMLQGFFSHFPFFTSYKVLRHFGQLVDQKRNLMYDYGPNENLRLYGQVQSPSYPIERINSRSLCLFSTEADALSTPRDVEKFKSRLNVRLYKDIFIEGDFNHLDLILHKEATGKVFKPMLEIFEKFELQAGGCSAERFGPQIEEVNKAPIKETTEEPTPSIKPQPKSIAGDEEQSLNAKQPVAELDQKEQKDLELPKETQNSSGSEVKEALDKELDKELKHQEQSKQESNNSEEDETSN